VEGGGGGGGREGGGGVGGGGGWGGGVTHVGEGLAQKGDLVLEAHEQTRVVACVCVVTRENK